jgi:hypothetical protein
MTLQLLPSKFPNIQYEEHFILFFTSVPSSMSGQFLDRKYFKSLKEFLSKDDLESI